eukprot:gnl/Hemi2/3037_TR1074_c0_g1_i1.p1 gnl/Hemi2/3037_TR1074_c0_g1~~gnl/Hemi2/3037_TR1074_c0_g1_i1.p1  ORF type:complete len:226 (+),score=51.81 gnl/Hemi2/3037_TR1074_c0_g1_i1:77-754(+)
MKEQRMGGVGNTAVFRYFLVVIFCSSCLFGKAVGSINCMYLEVDKRNSEDPDDVPGFKHVVLSELTTHTECPESSALLDEYSKQVSAQLRLSGMDDQNIAMRLSAFSAPVEKFELLGPVKQPFKGSKVACNPPPGPDSEAFIYCVYGCDLAESGVFVSVQHCDMNKECELQIPAAEQDKTCDLVALSNADPEYLTVQFIVERFKGNLEYVEAKSPYSQAQTVREL